MKVTVTPPAGVDVDPLVLVTVAVMMLTCPAVTGVVGALINTVYVVPVLVITAVLDTLPKAALTVS
jgi:hypothetical protein